MLSSLFTSRSLYIISTKLNFDPFSTLPLTFVILNIPLLYTVEFYRPNYISFFYNKLHHISEIVTPEHPWSARVQSESFWVPPQPVLPEPSQNQELQTQFQKKKMNLMNSKNKVLNTFDGKHWGRGRGTLTRTQHEDQQNHLLKSL